jgi:predicted neutral ceramidase superfamily lipid hydrolase
MTAAYEIPLRLLEPVRTGVILAAEVVTTDDGYHNGRLLLELADEWYAKVMANNRHEDLLKPAEAASLLAVVEIAIKYAVRTDLALCEDYASASFAVAVDEVRYALQEIANSDRLVFS